MKIFLAGDYYSKTGPAHATKLLLESMPQDTVYQTVRNKLLRIPEILWKTLLADVIIYSGPSRQMILGIKAAHLLHKPTFYIMHGSITHESSINHDNNKRLLDIENFILKHIQYILAVSIPFETWLKKAYPEYQQKIYHLTNAVDWDLLKIPKSQLHRNQNQIMSIGGGMPRKNILSVCKAINQLYLHDNTCNIRFLVAGGDGEDMDAIKSYPFVDYIGTVPHEHILSYMQQSALYIQNSVFETFGLAPLEALLCGCNLLLSCQTGALSIIPGMNKDEVIQDSYNIDELAQKISQQIKNSNHDRLLYSIDFNKTAPQYRVQELLSLIRSLI